MDTVDEYSGYNIFLKCLDIDNDIIDGYIMDYWMCSSRKLQPRV